MLRVRKVSMHNKHANHYYNYGHSELYKFKTYVATVATFVATV